MNQVCPKCKKHNGHVAQVLMYFVLPTDTYVLAKKDLLCVCEEITLSAAELNKEFDMFIEKKSGK